MNEKDDINDKIVVLKSRNKNKNEHNENPSLNISPQQMNEDTMKYLVRIKNIPFILMFSQVANVGNWELPLMS